jgi:hypothetical protein
MHSRPTEEAGMHNRLTAAEEEAGMHTLLSHPVFKTKTRFSSYVCPRSSCHTYDQNVSTEYQCLY